MSGLTAWERWELASFDEPPATGASAKTSEPEVEAEPEIKMPTVRELEEIRESAQQEGQKAGYEAGYETGYAEGQAKVQDEAKRLASAAEKLEAAFTDMESTVAGEILSLAVELARQVIRGELAAHPEKLLDVIRGALAELPHQHAAIYLHPDDASLARSYLGDQLTHAGHRIHEDVQLERGDCVIEAGGSHVDASVATRWRRTLSGLGLDSAWAVKDADLPPPAVAEPTAVAEPEDSA